MKLKDYWLKFRESFWFLPVSYGVLAMIMAVLSMYLEETIPTKFIENFVPNALLTDVKIGQTILNAIAVSVLTMTTITFSSIMVVLTTYSSQFSPRTLQDFISDVITQRVLGVFTGGFIYSLLLLLFLKDLSDKKLFLGPGIASIWAIVCLGFFVFFIHHVATWTQVNNLIDKITTRTQETIRNSFHLGIDQSKSKKISVTENIDLLEKKKKITINAPTSGYIQMIKVGPILEKATRNGHIIKIERRIGDYVFKDTPLYTYLDTSSLTDDDRRMYEECFSIGPERNTIQDVEFGIQKLVEIALRAISPAVNDPHTAINCINRIGTILSELGEIMFPNPYYYDQEDNLRVLMDIQSYRELLYKSFYQIRHYAKEDVSVCAATISVLHGIVERNIHDRSIHKIIWDFAIYFIEGIETDVLLEWDKQFINEKIFRLAKTIDRENEYKHLKL